MLDLGIGFWDKRRRGMKKKIKKTKRKDITSKEIKKYTNEAVDQYEKVLRKLAYN